MIRTTEHPLPTTALPALPGCSSPARYVREYRTRHGLPARHDPGTGHITMRARQVVGVMMPAALGGRVRDALAEAGAVGGPIVHHPRSQTWTLLADRDGAATASARLWHGRVFVIAANALIGLPSPVTLPDHAAYREWIAVPHERSRPALSTVTEALLALLPPGRPRA
ncbi:hypothetical protein [Nocardia thailandica]